MRIGRLILTIVTFTSFAASPAEPNCSPRRSQASALQDLEVQLANITSDTDSFGNADGRGTLTEKQADLGLSDAEVAQIRKSSGWVVCPGKKHKNPSVASAALVGSNMQITTAVHAFIDQQGRKREPLSDCYFLNQDNPAQKVSFDFGSGNYKFGTASSRKNGDPNDYAVVQLEKPIDGAIPFRADSSELRVDEWVIGIAAGQESPTRTFPRDEPVAQQCRVRGLQHPANSPTQYITDCDLSPMGSGGNIFARNSAGELVVKGIFTASGDQFLNGQPFDPSTGSFTRVVSVSEDFARDVAEVRNSVPAKAATLSN